MDKEKNAGEGMLKQAISSDKWDSAFKSMTPYNKNATLEDIIAYAGFHDKIINITVSPNSLIISESKWNGEEDE